jgi:hypothetical protein
MKARITSDGVLRVAMPKPAPYASVDMARLDLQGRRIIWSACDLQARMLLIDLAEWLYNHEEKGASCTLIHALEYLKDRLTYELYPWPKNCIPISWGNDVDGGTP